MSKYLPCILLAIVLVVPDVLHSQHISSGKPTEPFLTATAPGNGANAVPSSSVKSRNRSGQVNSALLVPVLIGPVYPPPLGNSFTSFGAGAGFAGGEDWYESNVALAGYTTVYWGPTGDLSMSYGSALIFDTVLSNLPGGIAVWSDGLGEQFTLTITDSTTGAPIALVSAGSVGLNPNFGGLLPVTSGMHFRANLLFTILGTPADDWWNFSVPHGSGNPLFTSFSAGYYYVNVHPSITPIADQQTQMNVGVGPLPFTVSDVETPPSLLVVSASSTNTAVIPNGGITLGGTDSNRTISLTPQTGAYGATVIQLSVFDGHDTTNESFNVTVVPYDITIEKFTDGDGNPNTTGDQAPKRWHLTLYQDSVTLGTVVSEADTSALFVPNLVPGTYIASEADSGWIRINGNGTRYDTLIVGSATSVIDTFINYKPNTIRMQKYADNDGNFSTTGDRSLKAWHLELHQGTAGGPLIAQTDAGYDSVGGLPDGTYFVTEADSGGWISLGYVVDATPVASADTEVQVIVSNGQSTTISFVNAPPIYGTTFRTFAQHLIGFDVDNKGKVGKFVVRKPNKDQFDIKVTTDSTNITDLHVEFGAAIDTAFSLTTVPSSTVSTTDIKLKKWDFVFGSALGAGNDVHILGYARTNKNVKVGKYWWTRSGTQVGKSKGSKDYVLANSILRLPMPNRVNAIEETFPPKGPTGLIVGKNEKIPNDSSKYYGWFQAPDYKGVLSTLNKKGIGQPLRGAGHPFDFYTSSGKIIKGQQKSMSPAVELNSLLANMIALRVNIDASDFGFVPHGFGDLIYSDPSDPIPGIDGLSIRGLAQLADSVMMGWLMDSTGSKGTVVVHKFNYSYNFNQLDSIIALIDSSFEGPLDTVHFASHLEFTGTKALISVPFLHADPGAVSPRVAPPIENLEYGIPTTYTLYQNYPNPFNPTTTIQFDLPELSIVTLKVYNILGQEVATLLDHEQMELGQSQVEFNGNRLPSGVYFYRLMTESVTNPDDGSVSGRTTVSVKKMLLIK